MKKVTVSEIQVKTGKVFSEARNGFLAEMAEVATADFVVFDGVAYDAKTDRHTAKFGTSTMGTSRKFSFRCTAPVAEFLAKHADARGQWFLVMKDGVIEDVTLFDYNG
jgi:hypothetical protein